MKEDYILAAEAALEIDLYLKNKETEFSNVEKLTELVEKCMVPNEDGRFDVSLPFLYALRGISEEPILQGPVEEYGLKMRLLYSDLRDFKSIRKERLEDLRDFCVELSREFTSNMRSKRYIA